MGHDRAILGPADVSDAQLTQMVARLLRAPADDVVLLDSHATEVDYDLPAITTAGRYWVRGRARSAAPRLPFSLFVKHVQSWARSPLFALVPPEMSASGRGGRAVAHRSTGLPVGSP